MRGQYLLFAAVSIVFSLAAVEAEEPTRKFRGAPLNELQSIHNQPTRPHPQAAVDAARMPSTQPPMAVEPSGFDKQIAEARRSIDDAKKKREKVGEWGRLDRIVFDGNETFTGDEIREALRTSFDVLAAGHVISPLENYPLVVADRVRAGYQSCGFGDVRVEAKLDREGKRIVVSIAEGPRYKCGDIFITAPKSFHADKLKSWLTSPHPRESSHIVGYKIVDGRAEPRWVSDDYGQVKLSGPVWKQGDDANWDASFLEWVEAETRRALDAMGCHYAKFAVKFRPDTVSSTASLDIEIKDKGPAARIRRIDVIGSQRDTPADVMAYLKLAPGDPYTDLVRAETEYKLWASARYLRQEVIATEALGGIPAFDIQIKLVDYSPVTPLRAPLTDFEQNLLKLREWLVTAEERGDDLALSWRSPRMTVKAVYSARDGMLLHLQPVDQNENGAADAARADSAEVEAPSFALEHPTYAAMDVSAREAAALATADSEQFFIARPGEVVELHAPWRSKLVVPSPKEYGYFVILHAATNPCGDYEEKPFAVTAGLGLSSPSKRALPMQIRLNLAPVVFLGILHRHECKPLLEGGVMSIAWPDSSSSFRFDTTTGALLSFSLCEEDGHGFEVAVSPHLFADALEQVNGKLAVPLEKLPNTFEPQRPVSSSLTQLLTGPLLDNAMTGLGMEYPQRFFIDRGRRAQVKLACVGALRPLDEIIARATAAPENTAEFSIPRGTNGRDRYQTKGRFEGVIMLAFDNDQNAFPYGCWASRLQSDAVLQIVNRSQIARTDYEELVASSACGPLGLLCAALTASDSTDARVLAAEGLLQLHRGSFARDYRPLLERDSLAGDVIRSLAVALRDTYDGEVTVVDAILFQSPNGPIAHAVEILRQRRDEQLEKVLPAALDAMWDHGLSQFVAKRLSAIINEEAQVPPPVAAATPAAKKAATQSTRNSRAR